MINLQKVEDLQLSMQEVYDAYKEATGIDPVTFPNEDVLRFEVFTANDDFVFLTHYSNGLTRLDAWDDGYMHTIENLSTERALASLFIMSEHHDIRIVK